jgi:hypothetical protein
MSRLRAVVLAPVLVRLAAAACAAVLCAVPILTAPVRPVAAVALLGLLLSGVGIAGPWRWAATAAACVFVVDYALALWIAQPPVGIAGAASLGLALVLWLQSVDLGWRMRGAAVDAAVLRSQAAGWLGFGAVTAAAALLVQAFAADLASSIPLAAAPILAAVGALGVVGAVVLALRSATRRQASPGRHRRL